MTPRPQQATEPGARFVVLDAELGSPLAGADDLESGLRALAELQEHFYDQLDANGEGGSTTQLALCLAPVQGDGTISQPIRHETVNGIRVGRQ